MNGSSAAAVWAGYVPPARQKGEPLGRDREAVASAHLTVEIRPIPIA